MPGSLLLLYHLVRRMGRASDTIIKLVSNRELVRSLPWALIRYRMRAKPLLLLRIVGIIAMVLLPPTVFLPGAEGIAWALGLIWASAVGVPFAFGSR